MYKCTSWDNEQDCHLWWRYNYRRCNNCSSAGVVWNFNQRIEQAGQARWEQFWRGRYQTSCPHNRSCYHFRIQSYDAHWWDIQDHQGETDFKPDWGIEVARRNPCSIPWCQRFQCELRSINTIHSQKQTWGETKAICTSDHNRIVRSLASWRCRNGIFTLP